MRARKNAMSLKIGALAARAGVNAPAIRYYEEIGLMPRPSRQDGGQRTYEAADLRRLTFIRRCRDFGFSIEQVRNLVGLTRDRTRTCTEARDLTLDHLREVRTKLAELQALEQSLTDFLQKCEHACAGGPGAECPVLDELADPAGLQP